MTATPAASPLVENLLRPIGLAAMVGCVALPLSQLITFVAPSLHRPLLFAACVLAALEVNYSHHLIRRRFISGDDALRFRFIEIGFVYILVRIFSLLLNGGSLSLNPADPLIINLQHVLASLLDLETILALILAVACALAVEDALNAFDQLAESPQADARSFSPQDTLTGLFFTGGGVLLVLSGLARVGLGQIFDLNRPAITGLVGNVLLYFVLGLVLLSQVHYERLTARWHSQGVRMPPELAGRWVRYTLFLLLGAGLVAFALPTGYTAGVLGLFGQVLVVLTVLNWGLFAILVSLLAIPLAYIMSLLAGAGLPVTPPKVVPPPNVVQELQKPLPPWVETVRTVLVIALVAGMILYIVVNYLRDRTGLAEALRRAKWMDGLRRLWAALRHRVSGLVASARDLAPLAWLRERLRRVVLPAGGYFRLGAASARDQVLFYYLSLLRRARERGFGRRPPQSPREYEPVLEQQLPEAAADLAALTAAFEETRYSAHPVDPAAAQDARDRWQRLRAALRGKPGA